MKRLFRIFPWFSPNIDDYPVAIQRQLKKPTYNLRSVEDDKEFKENVAALERLELMARHEPTMRLLLWVIAENVRKDFQIHHLRTEICKIRSEIRCLKSGQDPAEKSS